MRTTRLFATLTLALAVATPTWAADLPPALATASCVAAVRHTPTSNRFEAELYRDFDAYYDPHTEIFSFFGVAHARFLFQKCMTEHGLSLGEVHK